MKLITEMTESVRVISEASENGKKSLFIEGPFLVYDKPNRNNRMYSKQIMEREVNRYMNEYVKTKRALGELGHPDTPTINLERVSHMIVDLKDDGLRCRKAYPFSMCVYMLCDYITLCHKNIY